MITPYEKAISEIVTRICTDVTVIAKAIQVPAPSLLQSVIVHLRETSTTGPGLDARASWWRARARIYTASDGFLEALADSDPNLSPDDVGSEALASLPAVATWARDLAQAYHTTPCAGLDEITLRRKVSSLRTQMSHRANGTGILRIPYTVTNTLSAVPIGRAAVEADVRHMLLRVDIMRAEQAPALRRLPGESGAVKINRDPT